MCWVLGCEMAGIIKTVLPCNNTEPIYNHKHRAIITAHQSEKRTQNHASLNVLILKNQKTHSHKHVRSRDRVLCCACSVWVCVIGSEKWGRRSMWFFVMVEGAGGWERNREIGNEKFEEEEKGDEVEDWEEAWAECSLLHSKMKKREMLW